MVGDILITIVIGVGLLALPVAILFGIGVPIIKNRVKRLTLRPSNEPLETAIDHFWDSAQAQLEGKSTNTHVDIAILKNLSSSLSKLALRKDLRNAKTLGEPQIGQFVNECKFLRYLDRRDGIALILVKVNRDTEPHENGTWALVAPTEGKERHMRWECEEYSEKDLIAKLKEREDRVLERGESIFWSGRTNPEIPGDDIHRQIPLGGPVWDLVLIGNHAIITQPRKQFNTDTGEVMLPSPIP